ncbi:MAG: NUDIX hydrolase [Myxococcales bacterium]|nr:NUDIX hydrolase [Myxococcales bacterium]
MNATRERAAVVCVDAGALLCVRLRDPKSGATKLFPPGGGIEAGETPAQAAAREALEETGHRVVVDISSERVERYPFTWAGIVIDVTTHFFRAQLLGSRDDAQPVEADAIQVGVEWLPLELMDSELAYDATIGAAVRSLAKSG